VRELTWKTQKYAHICSYCRSLQNVCSYLLFEYVRGATSAAITAVLLPLLLLLSLLENVAALLLIDAL
jgi:hypothetical protein